jgi:hypothetical protein
MQAACAKHAHALGQTPAQGMRRRRGEHRRHDDAASPRQRPWHGGTLHRRRLDSGRPRSGWLYGREEKASGGSRLWAKQRWRWLPIDEEGGAAMAAASSSGDRRRLLEPTAAHNLPVEDGSDGFGWPAVGRRGLKVRGAGTSVWWCSTGRRPSEEEEWRRHELGGYAHGSELLWLRLRHCDERPEVEGAPGEVGAEAACGHALRTGRDDTLLTKERGFGQRPLFCTHDDRRELPMTSSEVTACGD